MMITALFLLVALAPDNGVLFVLVFLRASQYSRLILLGICYGSIIFGSSLRWNSLLYVIVVSHDDEEEEKDGDINPNTKAALVYVYIVIPLDMMHYYSFY